MAIIHVDGKEYEVAGSENLLEACLSLGLDIPYFCWHPALGSVGACRQCAVKQYQNADDTRGRIVMSCMTPASEGTYISIDDEEAKEFRQSVISWLMTNHPHDCPVCEEGGNCHLQDMTVMTGHSYRKYRFNKRTHNNQELGPFISHEMNRCIACYRCVRYYKDYADGTDFGVYGAHDNVYFGRVEDGTLENEFSGNLVEVCPTGVFTDKTHSSRYNRKWDMQFAPSICQQCSVGCNTSPGERYGELRRIENRYNGKVNHYFLCDRGRFGYGYVNAKDRPRQPQLKQHDKWLMVNAERATQAVADLLKNAKHVAAIGSARASIESNFALHELVGEHNFFIGMSSDELRRVKLMQSVLRDSGIYTPSLREIETYDAVLVLGEDITQTGARIALSVRQAVKGKAREMAAAQRVADWQIAAIQNIGQRAKYPLFVTSTDTTRLSDIAAWQYHGAAEDQARLGFAMAHAIDGSAPAVSGLDADTSRQIDMVVQALTQARKPLIITGTGAGSDAIIEAATNIANALKRKGHSEVGITFVANEVNSMGVAMLGEQSIDNALTRATNGDIDTLIVMENDLYRHASKMAVDNALRQVKTVIVVDHQRTDIMQHADVILPAASFAESDGTVINQEGRVQRFFQVFDPSYYDKRQLDESGFPTAADATALSGKSIMTESWRWLHGADSLRKQKPIDWTQLDELIDECVLAYPELAAMVDAAPDATFRIKGQKMARDPIRYSGRTAMISNISVHEPRQPQDKDSSFTFSSEGYSGTQIARQQIPFAWSPGWNSPQAWNKFQAEVGGSLKAGDPGIRLYERNDVQQIAYFDRVPAAFAPASDWRVAPYYHLFGSDEMSQRTDVIQQRMQDAYVMLSAQDAAQLGLKAGDTAQFECDLQTFALPIRVSDQLARGLVGLPLGYPGISPQLVGKSIHNLQGAAQ